MNCKRLWVAFPNSKDALCCFSKCPLHRHEVGKHATASQEGVCVLRWGEGGKSTFRGTLLNAYSLIQTKLNVTRIPTLGISL